MQERNHRESNGRSDEQSGKGAIVSFWRYKRRD